MKADDRTFMLERPRRAFEVGWNDKALESAPRITKTEVLEAVEERIHRALVGWFQLNAEKSRRTLEVTLPDRMSRIALEARMKHANDFVPMLQPARNFERALFMALQPHRKRAHAAQ